ncbi:MAG: signal peptidase I [Dehalococcoidia bacterium]|nr:signal peptidase I [Dehalococcoidia bacterium]
MRRLRPAFALAAAAASLVAAAIALLARWLRGRLYRVEVAGPSMLPALHPGDYLVVRRGAPPRGGTAFGRIVATRDDGGRLLLKRIVGLPGESLRVGRAVQVNRRVLVEPYALGEGGAGDYRGVNRLGDDEYILLGDNRAASTDSRHFGAVSLADIEGEVVLRYWPPERFGRLRRPRRELAGRVETGDDASGIVGGPGRPAGPLRGTGTGGESGNP